MPEYRSLDQVSEFPLCWPQGKLRAASRQRSPFRTSMAKAHQEIAEEMHRWRARGHVISMAPAYRQGRIDPGVALWWAMPRRNQPTDLRVLACDSYDDRPDNLHAIALTLTGLRAFERYGTYTREQAIEGARPMLPPPASDELPWWTILGVEQSWPLAAIEAVWRTKLEKAHPDRGGDPAEAGRLNAAMDQARKERG
ncbi:MAG: hypothetical protein IVW56_09555 [Candidatus Binataceae bacterium]|nr:hypothetical protein [Candidatus Binataceae bacterium]